MSSAVAMASVGDRAVLNVPLSDTLSEVWIDRDLGWLDFNARVLAEALDERTPLLERVKFLAIFTSNLDEFFMKRMAILRYLPNEEQNGLVRQIREADSHVAAPGGVLSSDARPGARQTWHSSPNLA